MLRLTVRTGSPMISRAPRGGHVGQGQQEPPVRGVHRVGVARFDPRAEHRGAPAVLEVHPTQPLHER
jgi:hypothetical protein